MFDGSSVICEDNWRDNLEFIAYTLACPELEPLLSFPVAPIITLLPLSDNAILNPL